MGWGGVLFLSVWVAGVYLCWWASAGGECFFLGVCSGWCVGFVGLFFVVCGGFGLPLLCLLYVFLYMFLLCVYWRVAGFACVGVFWGYGCGVLVFCFWRFLCLLVVVFCLVLVL